MTKRWTADDDTEILRMAQAGASYAEIAHQVGHSPAAVKSRLYTRFGTAAPYAQLRRADLYELIRTQYGVMPPAELLTQVQTLRPYMTAKSLIVMACRLRRAAPVQYVPRRWTSELVAQLAQDSRSMTVRELAAKYGLSYGSMWQRLLQEGIKRRPHSDRDAKS